MTLTTHGVAGAAIALVLRNHPVLAVASAFLSHFLLDAIPHWDHPIRSRTRDTQNDLNDRVAFGSSGFYRDVLDTSVDGILGLAIGVLIASWYAPQSIVLALLGAGAGIFPDFLQFLFFLFPHSPLRHLQRFHLWTHATRHLNNRPLIGVPIQIVFIICMSLFVKILF